MPYSVTKKLAEWREAESRARAAERSVTTILFARQQDPPRADTLLTEAKVLRQAANEKLKAAIAAMTLKPRR
jgi:hypothetical protein